MPLLTIDPSDARDHDDACYAHADDDPKNPGGHVIWVAIADVAAYVQPGTALDREARKRGNSSYFLTAWCRCCPIGCRATCVPCTKASARLYCRADAD